MPPGRSGTDPLYVLPGLVEQIYDSIADSGQWPTTLEAICRSIDSCLGMVGVVEAVANAARFSVAWGDERIVAPLVAGHAAAVPFYTAIPQMEIDTPYTVDNLYVLQGSGAREAWLSSPIARDWVIPNGLDDFFWVSLIKRPARTATMVLVTDRDRRPISEADLRLVSLVAPHVRRAVTIGDMLDAERQNASIFRTVLEELAHPVLVVGQDLELVFANPPAEELLQAGTVLSMAAGRLRLAYAAAHDAIARAVRLGMREEFALGPSGINVPLARAAAPAVAHVMPLARRDPSARFSSRAAAAIFVGVGGAAPLPAMEAIAALFGLTAAETRVAAQVAAGLARREIAAGSGLAPTTVQTQLAAIFDKTGVGDQRALQALIRELTPPARKEPPG